MRILIVTLFTLFNINNTTIIHESISASFNIIKRGHLLLLEIDFDEEKSAGSGHSVCRKVCNKKNYDARGH